MIINFDRRGLIAPDVLRGLSAKSDAKGALQMAGHLGAVVATGAALHLAWGTLWAIPAFVLHGVLLNFLYAAQHEFSHGTAFRTRAANVLFGRMVGFVSLYPRDFDQIQHFTHHKHTQDWDNDGDLERGKMTLGSYLWWLLGPGYWVNKVGMILRHAAGRVEARCIPVQRRAEVAREARWHLAGYALIAVLSVWAQSWAAVIYWLAPMLATKAAHQLQNAIEHLGMPHTPDIFRNTRSTRTNAVMRWMCWNMQHHTAHHAFPGVPFHNLAKLDKALFADRGIEPARMTYLGFQAAVIAALYKGPGEAAYADDEAWVGPGGAA